MKYSLILAALLMTFSLQAQASVKIGVVDMQTALQTVEAGRKAKAELEKSLNKKKAALEKEGKALEKATKDFQKQALVLSDKARMQKERELQQRVMKFEQAKLQTRQTLQQKEQDLTGPIIRDIRKVIASLANKGGYTVILEKNENSVLYSLKKDDLTAKVIKQYNKKY